jgi:hypothetical protein
MSKGSKKYFEMSCPRCGKPESNGKALIKVNINRQSKVSRKSKCIKCGKMLFKENINESEIT